MLQSHLKARIRDLRYFSRVVDTMIALPRDSSSSGIFEKERVEGRNGNRS